MTRSTVTRRRTAATYTVLISPEGTDVVIAAARTSR